MTDIPAVLANDFLAAQGLACIMITQLTAEVECIVTVGDIAARSEPGARIWFKRLVDAEKTLAAFFSRDQRSRRRPRGAAGLLVDADAVAVDTSVRDIAFSLGVSTIDASVIDEQFEKVFGRLAQKLASMKRSGGMKPLNREYAAAREAAIVAGTPQPPKFDLWLVDRLRPMLVDNAQVGVI
jgi:hypothetical protein